MVLLHKLEEDEDAEAKTSGAESYRLAHLVSVRLECPGRRVSKGWRGGERKRNVNKSEKLPSWHERCKGKSQWSISATSDVPMVRIYFACVCYTMSNFFTGLSNG